MVNQRKQREIRERAKKRAETCNAYLGKSSSVEEERAKKKVNRLDERNKVNSKYILVSVCANLL